jgi:hypothetical protein
VSELDLLGFLSFCGGNAECRLSSDVGGAAQRALVDFGSQHAAQTALILSGAPLADRNIRIEAVESRNALEDPGVDPNGKLSVIQAMLAAGYALPDDIVDRAREFDQMANAPPAAIQEIPQLTNSNETFDPTKAKPKVEALPIDRDAQLNAWYKVNEPVCYEKEIAMAKAQEQDEKFKILEPATGVHDYAVNKAKLIDGRFKLCDKSVAPPDKGLSMAKAGYYSLKGPMMDDL